VEERRQGGHIQKQGEQDRGSPGTCPREEQVVRRDGTAHGAQRPHDGKILEKVGRKRGEGQEDDSGLPEDDQPREFIDEITVGLFYHGSFAFGSGRAGERGNRGGRLLQNPSGTGLPFTGSSTDRVMSIAPGRIG
jgi:hypothetical protein